MQENKSQNLSVTVDKTKFCINFTLIVDVQITYKYRYYAACNEKLEVDSLIVNKATTAHE